MVAPALNIRPATDKDSDAVIRIVAEAYDEYEGCILLVEEEEPALLAPSTSYKKEGGEFWVVEDQNGIVASIGVVKTGQTGVWFLSKLYVLSSARKSGLGRKLCEMVEDWVKGNGGEEIELHTDTRFFSAHRLYERLGYIRQPETRILNDASNTEEFHYRKLLIV